MNLFFNLILTFLISCSSSEPRYVQLVHNEIGLFSKKMSKHSLILIGSGGALNKDIKIFSMSYRIQKEVDLREARKIFVSAAESFLDLENNNMEIRPYLHNYPLTIKNLYLSIGFFNLKYNRVHSPSIAYVSIPNMDPNKPTDLIFYSIYNPVTDSLETVHRETYEEALNIVKSQDGLQLY